MAQAKGKKPSRAEAQRLTEETMKKQLYVDPIDPIPGAKAPAKKKAPAKGKK